MPIAKHLGHGWRWLLAKMRAHWVITLLVVAYLLLVWALPRAVDERALRNRFEDWGMVALHNTTDVTLENVRPHMNLWGQARLDLHGLRIDSPNPEFERPFLEADPVRLRFPVWGLWGVGCQPRMDVKSLRIRVLRDILSGCNMEGVASTRYAKSMPEFPLGGVGHNPLPIRIRSGECIWEDNARALRLEMPLTGDFIWEPSSHLLTGTLPWATVKCYDDDVACANAQLRISSLRFGPLLPASKTPLFFRDLQADLQAVPLNVAAMVWPDIPPMKNACRLRGHVSAEGNDGGALAAMGVYGTCSELHIPALGVTGDVGVSLTYQTAQETGDKPLPALSLILRTDSQVHRCVAEKGPGGTWKRLALQTSRFDLAQFLQGYVAGKTNWPKYLLQTFPAITVDATRLRLPWGEIGKASLLTDRAAGGKRTLSLSGAIDDGSLSVAFDRWDVVGVPESWRAELKDAAAVQARESLASFIPTFLQTEVVSGRLSFSAGNTPPEGVTEESQARGLWSVKVMGTELVLPLKSAAPLFSQLVSIPFRLTDVEVLRRKSREIPVPPQMQNVRLEGVETLILSNLSVVYEVFSDGTASVRALLQSPQLGMITVGGKRHQDGTLKLAVVVRNMPEAYLKKNPHLSADLCGTVRAMLDEGDGLRLNVSAHNGKTEIEPRYLQDAFRLWMERHAAKQAEEVNSTGGKGASGKASP